MNGLGRFVGFVGSCMNSTRPGSPSHGHLTGLASCSKSPLASRANGTVGRLARELVERIRVLTLDIDDLTNEITTMVAAMAPTLLAIPGCGALTAAKILGETAGVDRFKSKDAYARHNGTAPMPVWSSNKARHRLSRTGNRQLNTALHRMALTQAHWYPPAKAMMERRKANGDGGLEALRVLKRRLSDVVYAALREDLAIGTQTLAA
jgi:transposase